MKTIVLMDLELYLIQIINIIMKVFGKILKNKDKENRDIQMGIYMKENGKKIYLMDMGCMNIVMVISFKEIFNLEKNTEKEFVIWRMDKLLSVYGIMMNLLKKLLVNLIQLSWSNLVKNWSSNSSSVRSLKSFTSYL